MVKQYVHYLRYLLQSITILTVIIGITGLGTLRAGQGACEPDCPGHQPKIQQASCCKTPGTSHAEILSSNAQENRQAAPSACDGILCIDSSVEVLKIAVNVSSSIDTAAVSRFLHVSETTVLHPQQSTFGQRYYPEKTTPIYMLTCVYLI